MQICIEICIITGALYSKCVSVIEMPLSFCRMPKTALEAKEWERRLKLFALRQFEFGRGQAPPTNSIWAKKKAKILKCPVMKGTVNLFGEHIKCSCGYHPKEVSGLQLLLLIKHTFVKQDTIYIY